MANSARDVQFVITASDQASQAFANIVKALNDFNAAQASTEAGAQNFNGDIKSIIQTLGQFDSVSKQIETSAQRTGNAFDQQTAKIARMRAELSALKAQSASSQVALAQIGGAAAATGIAPDAGKVAAIEAAQAALGKQVASTTKQIVAQEVALDGMRLRAQRAASLATAATLVAPNIAQAKVAADGLVQEATAAEKLGRAAPQIALATREIAVLGREAARGNYSRMAGSVTILAGAMGILPQVLLPVIAVLGVLAIAIKESADQADRLRDFSAMLKLSADGADYNAKALAADVEALRDYHVAAKDAEAALKEFTSAGLKQDVLLAFAQTAKDLSRITGTDFKKSAEELTKAFSGSYDALAKFDDEVNFLTADQREQIRQMFEHGNSAKALSTAFELLQKKVHSAAGEAEGPWGHAMDDASAAWTNFMRAVAASGIDSGVRDTFEALIGLLDAVADAIDLVTGKWDKLQNLGGGKPPPVPTFNPIIDLFNMGKWLAGSNDSGAAGQGQGTSSVTVPLPPASGSGIVNQNDQKRQKAEQDARDQISLEKQLLDATTETDKIRIEGEKAYRDEMLKTGDAIIANMKKEEAEGKLAKQFRDEHVRALLSSAESFIGKNADSSADRSELEALFSATGIKGPSGAPLDPEKVAWCAAFVNAVLQGNGIKGTGSLAASSFRDFGSKVTQPEPGDIVIIKGGSHVGFFEGFDTNGGVRVLGGNQDHSKGAKDGAVSEETFKASSIEQFRRISSFPDNQDGVSKQLRADEERAKAQEEFDHALDSEAAKRAIIIKYLQQELGMDAQKRYDLEKQKTIDEAVLSAHEKAQQKGLTFTKAQEDAIRATAGAQYDAEHAEQLINDRLREQQDLRQSLMKGIADATARGDAGTAATLRQQLDAMKPALDAAIDAAISFWSQFDSPEAKKALEGFRQLKQEIADTNAELEKMTLERMQHVTQGFEQLTSALAKQVDNAQLLGDRSGAAQAEQELTNATIKMVDARNLLIAEQVKLLNDPAMMAALGKTREEVEATIVSLQQANEEALLVGRQFLETGKQINESLADMGVSAAENFLTTLVKTRNVLTALWQTSVQFAADFLKKIGEMILKQVLFNALSAKSRSGGGGIGGMIAGGINSLFGKESAAPLLVAGTTLTAASGALASSAALWQVTAASLMAAAQTLLIANSAGAGIFHGGGIAGAASITRAVSPFAFAGALRYHTGGMAGLRADEVPAILQRGEEILTRGDPRHRYNRAGSGGGGATRGIRQILALGDDEIAKAMAGAAGEEVLITHLKRNRSTIRAILEQG